MALDATLLRTAALQLDSDWWLDILASVAPTDASIVRNLGSGSTTSELPVDVAAHAVATLDIDVISDAVQGDTRVAVTKAIGDYRPPTSPLFTGTLDDVAARIAARKTIPIDAAISGLASRSRDDQLALAPTVMAKVAHSKVPQLGAAALDGTLDITIGELAEAWCSTIPAKGSDYRRTHWLQCTWTRLDHTHDNVAQVAACAAAFARVGVRVPNSPLGVDIARAAAAWPRRQRHFALFAGAVAGATWADLAPLATHAPSKTIADALSISDLDPTISFELLTQLDVSYCRTISAHTAARILTACGDRADHEMLTALLDSGAANSYGVTYLIGALAANSAHGPSGPAVADAFASLSVASRTIYIDSLDNYLKGNAASKLRPNAWSGKAITRLEGPAITALLVAVGQRDGWQRLAAVGGTHPAAAGALGVLCVDALERAGCLPGSAGSATFFSMLCDWDGTLDELADLAAKVAQH